MLSRAAPLGQTSHTLQREFKREANASPKKSGNSVQC